MTGSGKITAVIFDWAGTTVDHGSLAPVRVLMRVFESRGVQISEAEARRDMGVLKRDHIQRIVSSPAVSERWLVKTRRAPSEKDVDALFADFVPRQLECLVRDSAVIDGVAETVARLRKHGIKIGSTTGYTREMMDLLAPAAAAGGYHPDCMVTPDDVGGGRPHPWMIFHNAIRLKIDDLSSIVKIGDTISDVEEGLNAGVWTIGVARTGNLIGMSAADFAALPNDEQRKRLERARTLLREAGAHEVVDSVADCERQLAQIEQSMRDGRSPAASS
ncbi:MAG: phosphonoacetaldehyde hydrolase [Candidatus Binataceae bacterium]